MNYTIVDGSDSMKTEEIARLLKMTYWADKRPPETIDPEYRHMGLGAALVSHIVSRPEYAGLRGFLITRDAHGLYRKFGYEVVNDRVMVKAPVSKPDQ